MRSRHKPPPMKLRVVYESEPATILDSLIAIITIGALFTVMLAYVVIVPLLVYFFYVHASWISALLLLIAIVTPLLGSGPWRAFGDSYGFYTWRKYMRLKVLRSDAFAQGHGSILCFVPHGLFPLALPLMSKPHDAIFPEFKHHGVSRTAVASDMLWTPIIAPMLRWLGCIPATKESITRTLASGNVIIFPDGIAGAFHSQRHRECIYIQNRKGFIKLALELGAPLVPVFCFGHSQLYDVYPGPDSWIARLSRRLQFSIIWFWGKWWWPALPNNETPLTVAVGRAIPVQRIANPNSVQVDALHQLFCSEVKALFQQAMPEAYPNQEIVFV